VAPDRIAAEQRTAVGVGRQGLIEDLILLSILMVLAGCGLVYEFLLSHYAARVLGATEVAIFGVFTIMIASMGIGAFLAQRVACPFTGFAWLEWVIGVLGAVAILVTAAAITATYVLPNLIAYTYGVVDVHPEGSVVHALQQVATSLPYVMAFLLGCLIGAEIPLIARVREQVHAKRLQHNTGTLYGIDYIGAGIGALLFVFFLLRMEASLAAAIVASVNLVMGLVFFLRYRQRIRAWWWLLSGHLVAGAVVVTVALAGPAWQVEMEDMLYKDQVIYSSHTPFQRFVVTRRIMDPAKPPVYALFINGHAQFSSRDERLYHAMLTYPAMAASARHERVLIVGGGDGLALRDVLRWDPKQVTLIDLDRQIIDFFTQPKTVDGRVINTPLLALNRHSFRDPRVHVLIGDAFNRVDELLTGEQRFDTIIIDLPDPNHPDLGKLYSTRFYAKLYQLLAGDGALVTQSTSPYHARRTFISIGKTLKAAGFSSVEQYHANVPTFGEWGWTIAVPHGRSASDRLREFAHLPVDDGWTTREWLLGAFAFPKGFFDASEQVAINRLDSNVLYDYYRDDWRAENDF